MPIDLLKIFFLSFGILLTSGLALAQDPDMQLSAKPLADGEEPKKYRLLLGAEFASDLPGDNPRHMFQAIFSYQLSEKIGLSAIQRLRQRIYLSEHENRFDIDDTILSASYALGQYYELNHSIRADMTLPISLDSRENETYTSLSLMYSAGHQPFEKTFLSYGLSASSFLARYRSSASGSSGGGGIAGPVYSFGFFSMGSYNWTERLRTNYFLINSRTWYYDLSPDKASAGVSSIPDDSFFVNLSMSYALNDYLQFASGLRKGNLISELSLIDFAIFDGELNQYFFSLNYSTSF